MERTFEVLTCAIVLDLIQFVYHVIIRGITLVLLLVKCSSRQTYTLLFWGSPFTFTQLGIKIVKKK